MSENKEELAVKVMDQDFANVAFSGPAVFSNRFFVVVGPGGVRITFAEHGISDAPPSYRTAVIMPMQDGVSLYRVLQESLRGVENPMQPQEKEILSQDAD